MTKETISEKFKRKMAYQLSRGKYTIEDWPSDFETCMMNVINALPSQYTREILLKRWEGISSTAIASELKIPSHRVLSEENTAIRNIYYSYNLRKIAFGINDDDSQPQYHGNRFSFLDTDPQNIGICICIYGQLTWDRGMVVQMVVGTDKWMHRYSENLFNSESIDLEIEGINIDSRPSIKNKNGIYINVYSDTRLMLLDRLHLELYRGENDGHMHLDYYIDTNNMRRNEPWYRLSNKVDISMSLSSFAFCINITETDIHFWNSEKGDETATNIKDVVSVQIGTVNTSCNFNFTNLDDTIEKFFRERKGCKKFIPDKLNIVYEEEQRDNNPKGVNYYLIDEENSNE